MSVVIRMKRTGRRNRPCYRISVSDSRWPRDGRTLENLGLYDPVAPQEEDRLTIDLERARHWMLMGAQPSDTVRSILRKKGVLGELPEAKKRKRSRKRSTATHQSRVARAKTLGDAKAARAQARKDAAKAAKAAAAASSDEG